MKLAFVLRRRPDDHPAVALYWPSRDPAGLLGMLARGGLDPSGRVFDVAGGFLVTLETPSSRPVAGAIRLRRLAANLYLPADAALVPALLDDEAEGLARRRGLVFLPGGRLLGFDPHAALDLATLLAADGRPRRDWGPLPDRPVLSDRIEEILFEWPDESPEAVFESGGESIGTEEPRPEDSGAASKFMGRAALGAGRGMIRLGKSLGIGGLAGLGAGWVGRALSWAPRLSEDLLGRQAAALRDLLREFREGDLDRALRRALPLGDPGSGRGAGVFVGDRLPPRDLSYSLNDFLGRQPAGVWLGGQDIMAELTREYRKAAEQALKQGDFRRAASIYGKLLRDYRAAAQALLKGGLHHDAAILFLAKLDDRASAARAFESAGEFDRAVQLYRQRGDHVAAGDLLRRIGEEEAAVAEYIAAADQLIASGADHLAAGNLLANKAGRADLALPHYRVGWSRRPAPNDLQCALAALTIHAEAGACAELTALVDEVEIFLGPPEPSHQQSAGTFYHDLYRLAGRDRLAPIRDDLRDRALMGLASKVRQGARAGAAPGPLVTSLLGKPGLWAAPVVRDADFAAKALAKRPPEPRRDAANPRPVRRYRVGVGLVTAVGLAPLSDEIFVGFDGGEIYCFRPERSEVVRVAAYDFPVASVAAHPEGRSVVVLRAGGAVRGALSSYERAADGSYRLLVGMSLEGFSDPWLTQVVTRSDDKWVGMWDGMDLHFLAVDSLQVVGKIDATFHDGRPGGGLLFGYLRGDGGDDVTFFLNQGSRWVLYDYPDGAVKSTGLNWRLSLPEGNPLRVPPLSWRMADRESLEVAGLGESGTAHWAAFHFEDGTLNLVSSNVATDEKGYLAATIVRPGLVAAVTRSRVDWFGTGARFALRSMTGVAIPSAVACFPSRKTNELVVVCDDGFIVRMPIPI